MTTYFISDLHLSSSNSANAKLFFKFLANNKESISSLFILGDFWDAWIGDDDNSSFITKVKQELKSLSKTAKLYIMPGNRDFLIGKKFAKSIGATLLPDPCIMKIYGKQVILSHGDVFCTADKQYQKYRKIIRSKFVRILASIIPKSLRVMIKSKLRECSKSASLKVKELNIWDVDSSAIINLMQKLKIYTIIHGHTHVPAIHRIKLNEYIKAKRIVLGEWKSSAYILKYQSNHSIALEWFN